jgi:hypothetical protein
MKVNSKFLFLILLQVFFLLGAGNAQNDSLDAYVQPQNEKSTDPLQNAKNSKDDFAERLRYGGSFGAFFGQQTYIELSPKVGYKVDKRLIVGVGANYIYYSIKDYGQKFVTHIYGPTVFAQYSLISGLFAYGEFNGYNVASYSSVPPYNAERIWIGSAPVGIGYYSGGQIGGVYLSILYDLINNPYSPYYNGGMPILLRVGFLF